MLIEAYYELNPDRKRPCETQSPKWKLYSFLIHTVKYSYILRNLNGERRIPVFI
jgi:hypothetical protein